VVAGKTDSGFDPSGPKTHVRVTFEKRKGQDVTGAIGEEMTIRSLPSPDGIILDVDLWEKHPTRRTCERLRSAVTY